MRIKHKTRKTLKQIGSLLLIGVLICGVIMGSVAISKKLDDDTRIIHPDFKVGGLDENGEYKKTENTIYTMESFECLGLKIKLDFDANVKYQVYFYDELDNFVSTSDVYEESMEIEVPENAKLARLVVEPIWESDVKEKDRVCHWYDTYKYVKQLEIKVLKDQEPIPSEDASEN